MSRFHIAPMVYDHIDSEGIWWRGSKDGLLYIFYWNPIKVLYTIFFGKNGCYFGFLPFKTKHLK